MTWRCLSSTGRELSGTSCTELERRAQVRRTITYGEAAALIGWATQDLGKILTAIRIEEAARSRPDLGALVVRVSTGLPSYVPLDQAHERAKVIAVQEAVFAAWAGLR